MSDPGQRSLTVAVVSIFKIVVGGLFALFGGGCTLTWIWTLGDSLFRGSARGMLGAGLGLMVVSVVFLVVGIRGVRDGLRQWRESAPDA
jgi:hypothetical protein